MKPRWYKAKCNLPEFGKFEAIISVLDNSVKIFDVIQKLSLETDYATYEVQCGKGSIGNTVRLSLKASKAAAIATKSCVTKKLEL